MDSFCCDFCHKSFDGVSNRCLFCNGQFCLSHTPAKSHDCSGLTRVWDKSSPAKGGGGRLTTVAMAIFLLIGILLGMNFRPTFMASPEVRSPPDEAGMCVVPHSLYVPYDEAVRAGCAAATN